MVSRGGIGRVVAGLLAVTGVLGVTCLLGAAPAAADSIRDREWVIPAVRADDAWRYSRGNRVLVAVLDTGVSTTHPDLAGSVVTGPDFTGTERVRRPGDRYWGRHGTAMASIIAGHGHGRDLGVLGIAPRARILSIRVTLENNDPLRADPAVMARSRGAVARGIRYAVDHGARVISMSLGGGTAFYDGDPAEEEAVRYALAKGAVLVASAGNDGALGNRRNFPAAYPGVVAVGAVDRRLRPVNSSNHHDYVAVAAPGVQVVGADATGGYVLTSGTSPSCAVVAGVLALIRARFPHLGPSQVRQALIRGVSHAPRAGHDVWVGNGVADALRAIRVAAQFNGSPTSTPASTATRPPSALPAADGAAVGPLTQGGGFVGLTVGAAVVLLGVGVAALLGRRHRHERPDAWLPVTRSAAPGRRPGDESPPG